jgi:Leucine-rich repeat (LRR) protein
MALPSCNGILLPNEYFALEAIYISTHGNNWIKPEAPFISWNFDTIDLTAPCTQYWQGLACGVAAVVDNVTYCVVGYMNLASSNLVGSLPSDIGQLQYIEYVDMSYNALTGQLPPEVGKLGALEYIFMHYNYFSGTLSTTIMGSLTQLRYCFLYHNVLSGTIPTTVFQSMSQLVILYLMQNQFTTTVPVSLTQIPDLVVLGVNENYLTGSVPSEFGSLLSLIGLGFYMNYLTNTLPSELGSLQQAFGLGFYSNMLTGTLPESYCSLPQMMYFAVDDNQLSGSIPACYCDLVRLTAFGMKNNMMTGSLPNCLGNLVTVEELWLDNNKFTGTIPSSLGQMQALRQLTLSSNELRGVLPAELVNAQNLQMIQCSNNLLEGTLPVGLNSLRNLSLFNASKNSLSGKLGEIFNSDMEDSTWPSLEYMDLSSNQFSGTLPGAALFSDRMKSLSLNLNCFEGSLPSAICASTQMETLILDGLVTGSSCLMKVSGAVRKVIAGSFSTRAIQSTIPTCIWQLTNLVTFHIADNGLTGTISGLHDESQLVDINLSNNHLSGSIPSSFQKRGQFQKLILSENKFSGVLLPDFQLINSSEAVVNMRVNRLSGIIPAAFFETENSIDILSGNLFGCTSGHAEAQDGVNGLPAGDPTSSQYSCGSNNFNNSLITWIVCAVVIFGVLVYCNSGVSFCGGKSTMANGSEVPTNEQSVPEDNLCYRCCLIPFYALSISLEFIQQYARLRAPAALDGSLGPQKAGSLRESMEESNDLKLLPNCNKFFMTMKRASSICVLICCLQLFIALPIYVVFKNVSQVKSLFASHTVNYTWVSTVVYLHGFAPIVVVVVLTMLSQQLMCRYFFFSSPTKSVPVLPPVVALPATSVMLKLQRVLIHLFNIGCTLCVNFAYVAAIIHGLDTHALLGIQAGLSLYKLVWDKVVVPSLINKMSFSAAKNSTSHQVFMTLFNYIFGPIIAVITTDSSCLLYVFVAQPTITSSFTDLQPSDPTCSPSTTSETVVCGVAIVSRVLYTHLKPTWRYSYQCGSQLLIDYVPVLMLTYTISGIIAPCLRLGAAYLPAEWIRRYVPRVVDEWMLKDSILFQDRVVTELEKKEDLLDELVNCVPSPDSGGRAVNGPPKMPPGPVSMQRKAQIRHIASVRDMATLSRSHLFDGSTVVRRSLLGKKHCIVSMQLCFSCVIFLRKDEYCASAYTVFCRSICLNDIWPSRSLVRHHDLC